jgi:hypothetical protein
VRLASGNRPHPFRVFRPAEPGQPVVRLTGHEQFRCHACGGLAVLDEVERFSTFDTLVTDEPRPRRCGRPPKAWRAVRDSRLDGLDLAS